MSPRTLPIRVEAVIGQLSAIAEFGIKHDQAKLTIRCALRDALDRLERPDRRLRLAPPPGPEAA